MIEKRRQKGVKSAHGRLGGEMEEGACPANKDLAKCSHCVCTVPFPWAEAVAAQELCCSCGLPHLHPSALSFRSSYLTSALPSHPLSPLSAAWEQTRVGFSPSPLFSHSPHQPWCPQQYFQKEGNEILFFLFFLRI